MTSLGKPRAIATLLVVFLISTGLALPNGCARRPESELVSALPGVDRTLARHLVSDDDSTLAWYARTIGVYPLHDAGTLIVTRFHAESSGEFLAARKQLLPVLQRIADVQKSEFDSRYFEGEVRFWSHVSADDAVRLGGLRSSWTTTLMDTTKSALDKAEELRRLLPDYESIGYLPGVAGCNHEIGNLLAASNKADQLRHYRDALAVAELAGMYPKICQILGTLGHEAAVAGHTDSMFYYWNRSRKIAERHKLPDYSARIYEFFGRHYQTEGRLALAHDLYQEAQAVCRRYKGGYRELRFLVVLVEFYNELGCWEISGRLLPRAEVLEAQLPEDPTGAVYPFKLRARLARARYLMATGHVEEAERLLIEIKPYVRRQLQRDQYPRLLYTWGRDLMQHGRRDDALTLIDEGLAWSEDVNFPYLVPMFHMLLAESEYDRGRHAAALAALASFESATKRFPAKYRREWISCDVIRTRLLLARGDADSAVVELKKTLTRLEGYLSDLDASTHGYLWLNQRADVRDLLHDVTSGDNAAAYGASLYWCGLYRYLGGEGAAPVLPTRGNPLEYFRRLAVETQKNLQRTNRIHCSYQVAGGRLCRFMATPGGVRHDDLPVPVPELRRLVSQVWEQTSDATVDKDAPVPRSLITPLRALALQLLPRDVLDVRVTKPRPLLVTARGFLASLPFEALNLAADGSYRPLLQDWDVSYVRCATTARRARASQRGELVVADPTLSARLRRRLSVSQPLPGAALETARITEHLRDPVVLDGAEATKQLVTKSWDEVSLLYVAAHFLTNPEVPYLTMLPLADTGADGETPPDAEFLDIGDVRAADFEGCDLVVLSGCATGAPYVAAQAEGPGFGDAFLDAGAGSVVQTFWHVRDDDAFSQMSAFVKTWRSGGAEPWRALSRVRRGQIEGPRGVRHPYHWAAFSIKLRDL